MALLPLCRVPSEALPITIGKGSGPNALYTEGQELKLELQRRKNRVESTTLIRRCWCSQSVVASYHAPVACQRRLVYVSQETCPVHVVGNAIAQCEAGSTLFQGITPGITVAKIREVLASLGVSQAEIFGTHDFRRGHAKDLQVSGAPLYEILAAGQWKSPAFLAYLDIHKCAADTNFL